MNVQELKLSNDDLYYFRAILRRLREFQGSVGPDAPLLGREALADEIDWLDCFIDKHERKPADGK